jgi:hypothetical protein
MMRGGLGRIALVVTLAAAGVAIAPTAGSLPVLVPRTLRDVRPAGAGLHAPGFPIDAVGAVWAGDHPATGAEPEVRFLRSGGWSAWVPMGEDGAAGAGRFATALVDGDDAEGYEVRNVPPDAEVVALNTTDGPLVEAGRRHRGAAAAALPCRSRADWGADESLTTGTRTYVAPQVLTVHHTATSNEDAENDPAAQMRAILGYHTTGQGFDDFGYQYVIDRAGVVYEGRSSGPSASCLTGGGDGSDFGHEEAPADRAVVGAHVAGWNSGNLGVALLGTATTEEPPAAQREALEELLADLAVRHDLDPADTSYEFTNPSSSAQKTVAVISGHRDWGMETECPGGALYDTLPSIRTDVAARIAAMPPPSTTTTSTTTTSTTTTSTTTTSTVPVTTTTAPPPPARSGYWMVTENGDVYAFGDAAHHGNSGLRSQVVDIEPTPSGHGYWIVDAYGNVTTHGDATASPRAAPALAPYEAVTSLSSAGAAGGYWLFTSRGRVLAYDGAPSFGDMGATALNGPVLDSIATPSGRGYYLVAADGGIFTFGDAVFHGSMGDTRLNAPVQSLVPDGDGAGYWLVAEDGGIFAFTADFFGSMGDTRLNRPVTGMVADGSAGYLMVAEDGGIFSFGTARFHGSLGANPPSRPVVAVATVPA